MDEDFAGFLEDFGPAIEQRHVPPSSIERYRGKLPDQLLSYWKEHGWCGYADGLFWTVDPQEYEPVLDAWIGDTPFMEKDAYHIFARSAFGELYLWGEKTGNSLNIFPPGSYCLPRESKAAKKDMNFAMQLFFGALDREDNDFEGMFAQTLKKLGRLHSSDMYGFVPALALGGEFSLKNLQTVKAVEHLVILAQLAPLEVITHPSQI